MALILETSRFVVTHSIKIFCDLNMDNFGNDFDNFLQKSQPPNSPCPVVKRIIIGKSLSNVELYLFQISIIFFSIKIYIYL